MFFRVVRAHIDVLKKEIVVLRILAGQIAAELNGFAALHREFYGRAADASDGDLSILNGRHHRIWPADADNFKIFLRRQPSSLRIIEEKKIREGSRPCAGHG